MGARNAAASGSIAAAVAPSSGRVHAVLTTRMPKSEYSNDNAWGMRGEGFGKQLTTLKDVVQCMGHYE
jgi:hypothetical protein